MIALATAGVLELRWASEALLLRLGSIAVDIALCMALNSRAVRGFFSGCPNSAERIGRM